MAASVTIVPCPTSRPPADIMSRKEAAAYLRMSLRTLAGLQENGPALLRVKGRVWYLQQDLDRWLVSCRETTSCRIISHLERRRRRRDLTLGG